MSHNEVDEIGEETILKPNRETSSYANHPKIKRILKNPDVKEIHIRFKRGNQLYICIVFLNGSTIERPLQDILDDEEPLCPAPEENEECNCGHTHKRAEPRHQIVSQKKSKWNFLNMKNRGQSTDIASIVENNENITVKRVVTIVKKGCGCENTSHRHSRRVPVEYEEIDE